MRLRRLKIQESEAGGGLFDGADILFGRDAKDDVSNALDPLCLIGPNGSGKSQFLQLIAEIFQAAWHAHDRKQERLSANERLLFDLTYSIVPEGRTDEEEVRLVRTMKGRARGPIELYRGEELVTAASKEFARYLPPLIVGYTSGDNETLSLPFLASRAGYADDVAKAALRKVVDGDIADNRMMLIDYGTNLEVLFANMILGKLAVRNEIIQHANLADLASCRCTLRLSTTSSQTKFALFADCFLFGDQEGIDMLSITLWRFPYIRLLERILETSHPCVMIAIRHLKGPRTCCTPQPELGGYAQIPMQVQPTE